MIDQWRDEHDQTQDGAHQALSFQQRLAKPSSVFEHEYVIVST